MAQRPISNQKWQERSVVSCGPRFRIDTANPQMGLNGADVYNVYAVTDNKDIYLTGLSEGGLAKIYNDHSLEIITGQKSQSTGIDIVICGRNGDVTITAEKNGQVRIRAKNIVLDADENVNINAGKDVKIKAGGRFLIQSNQADCDALTGNLAPKGTTFGEMVFKGTYVGSNIVSSAFNGGSIKTF